MKKSTKQDGRPSFQFYPGDWMGGSGSSNDLRLCSLEARGLWIDIVCIAFFSPKRGQLLTSSGIQIDYKMLTKLVGEKDEEKIKPLLEELKKVGVLSMTKNGTMYNRRMYRENRISDIRREAVEKRWGKKPAKERIQNGYKVDTKSLYKTDTKPIQTGEDEVEEEVLVNKISNKRNKEMLFEKIWKKYPDKDGKKDALRHFIASVNSPEDWKNINIALANYLQSDRVKNGFIKKGSTWFNGWADWVEFKGNSKVVDMKDKFICDDCKKPSWLPANVDDGKRRCADCFSKWARISKNSIE